MGKMSLSKKASMTLHIWCRPR